MPSPRRARQGEPFKDAFVRVLEQEERELGHGDPPQSEVDPATDVALTSSASPEAVQDPISDLYRQHSHQQSMEGG